MEDGGAGLILSILVAAIGFVFFSYGRKMSAKPQLLGGICLMAFPYFVSSVLGLVVVAVVLIGAILLARRAGF